MEEREKAQKVSGLTPHSRENQHPTLTLTLSVVDNVIIASISSHLTKIKDVQGEGEEV